jgi:LCP family protein required for cell wall assembly
LLIQTVENLTDVRVDHFGVIDFAGFQQTVDSVGGIDVRVAAATSNVGVGFNEGLKHLDGAQALPTCVSATTCRTATWTAPSASRTPCGRSCPRRATACLTP